MPWSFGFGRGLQPREYPWIYHREVCLGVRKDDDVHYGRGHFVLYSGHMDTLAVIVMTGLVSLLVCQIGGSSSFSLRRTVTSI